MVAGKQKRASRSVPANTGRPPTIVEKTELALRAQAFDNMPPTERVAALMHLVYIVATQRPDVDWTPSLPENWVDLEDRARNFNLKIMETWAENPALFEIWVEAVRGLIADHRSAKRSKPNPAGKANR